jgi:hypothetical protein
VTNAAYGCYGDGLWQPGGQDGLTDLVQDLETLALTM